MHMQKKTIMADSFATQSTSLDLIQASTRPLVQYLEVLLIRKAAQIPLLSGKHSESFVYFCLLTSMELIRIPI